MATKSTDDLGTSASVSAHTDDASDAHDASAVSFAPAGGIAATDVQAAIEELDTDKANASDLTDHTGDTTDAHDASAISFAPAGSIAATDVQAAIEELDADVQAVSGPTVVRKAADQTVDNSTTLVDDTALTFAIGANETWVADFDVIFDNGAANGKAAVTSPGGSTIRTDAILVDATSTVRQAATASGTELSFASALTGEGSTLRIHVSVANGATPGNVTLQYAQVAAGEGDPVGALLGSTLIAHQVA